MGPKFTQLKGSILHVRSHSLLCSPLRGAPILLNIKACIFSRFSMGLNYLTPLPPFLSELLPNSPPSSLPDLHAGSWLFLENAGRLLQGICTCCFFIWNTLYIHKASFDTYL